MKKNLYILSIALAFGFVACDKTEETNTRGMDGIISFAPQTPETRAFINDAAGLQSKTLQVWDIWSNQTTTSTYINDKITYATPTWTYSSGSTYTWKEGTHKFFSYIDGTGTYDATNQAFSVSKTLTTASADQEDILYSDLFVTTAADWKSDHTAEAPVPLNFKHMFSAVAISVQNCTENVVTLTSVSKPAIPNKGSATVDYSGAASTGTAENNQLVPAYGTVTVDGAFVTAEALSGVELSAAAEATDDTPAVEGGKADVLAQAAATDIGYYLVWPQTIAEETIQITVKYTVGDDTTPYERQVYIPATTWERGNKYSYTLQILPSDVRLIFNVMPWETGEAGEIDTSTGSINMSNLTWMNAKVRLTQDGSLVNTLNNGAYSVTMFYKPWVEKTTNNETVLEQTDGFYPAKAYFTVNYPLSGQFKIGLIPAYGQTSVDKTKFEIWVYKQTGTDPENDNKPVYEWVQSETAGEYVSDITHDTVYFQIRAAASVEAASTNPEYRAQVDIWFKGTGADDEWISAYSEIRANYAVIIPAR